jgi:hypothetical protein
MTVENSKKALPMNNSRSVTKNIQNSEKVKRKRVPDDSPTEELVKNSHRLKGVGQKSPHEREVLTRDFQQNLDKVIQKNLNTGSYVLEQDGAMPV